MRIVAKEVRLDMLSAHLFRLNIAWENGIAVRPDVALLWRGITPNNSEAWTEEEDALIMRGSISAHWFLPLDSISYAGIDVAADDAAEKLYVSAYPYGAPHPA